MAKTLTELAADGAMDPGWALALQPVAGDIAAMAQAPSSSLMRAMSALSFGGLTM